MHFAGKGLCAQLSWRWDCYVHHWDPGLSNKHTEDGGQGRGHTLIVKKSHAGWWDGCWGWGTDTGPRQQYTRPWSSSSAGRVSWESCQVDVRPDPYKTRYWSWDGPRQHQPVETNQVSGKLGNKWGPIFSGTRLARLADLLLFKYSNVQMCKCSRVQMFSGARLVAGLLLSSALSTLMIEMLSLERLTYWKGSWLLFAIVIVPFL